MKLRDILIFVGLVLLIGVSLAAVLSRKPVSAGPSYVQNNITVSSEWTPENSPYVIQNDITVSPGAVLTIDPGVTVRFVPLPGDKAGTGPNLVIEGGLKAVSSHDAGITFVSAEAGKPWGALYFFKCDSANSLLDGCRIIGGRISCNNSSPTITSCSISEGKRGIEVSTNSQPKIIGNQIKRNGYGMVLMADTASPVVQNNDIVGNQYGIYMKAMGAPVITENRIYDNLKYNIVNSTAKPLGIPNNNFNATNSQEIARGIYDNTSNPALGRLNYMPFVVASMPSVPVNAPALARAPAAANVPSVSNSSVPALERGNPLARVTVQPKSNPLASVPAPSSAAPAQSTAPVQSAAPAQMAAAQAQAKAPATPVPTAAPVKSSPVQVASRKTSRSSFNSQFSLTLDVTGHGAFGSSNMGSTGGFGGLLFADFRPIEYISLGVGINYIDFPGSKTWQVGPVDLGGRLFPFGTGRDGEGYLMGGLGFNLVTQSLSYMTPGNYHMFAGGGYRAFVFGPTMGLDLGLQLNYYSRTATSSPLYDMGVKAGLAWMFDTK